MGANGVGKSVLLSCLAGSERPSAGSVDVFGEPATTRADTTSFLLQDALALEKPSIHYRRLHPAFTDDWRTRRARLLAADDLDKSVADYSGGMVRKLEFTIAASIDVPCCTCSTSRPRRSISRRSRRSTSCSVRNRLRERRSSSPATDR